MELRAEMKVIRVPHGRLTEGELQNIRTPETRFD